MDQEGDELKHALELVLGGAFARTFRWNSLRKFDAGCRRGSEVSCSFQPAPDGRPQLRRGYNHCMRAVRGELFAQHLSVPERNLDAVPGAVVRGGR